MFRLHVSLLSSFTLQFVVRTPRRSVIVSSADDASRLHFSPAGHHTQLAASLLRTGCISRIVCHLSPGGAATGIEEAASSAPAQSFCTHPHLRCRLDWIACVGDRNHFKVLLVLIGNLICHLSEVMCAPARRRRDTAERALPLVQCTSTHSMSDAERLTTAREIGIRLQSGIGRRRGSEVRAGCFARLVYTLASRERPSLG